MAALIVLFLLIIGILPIVVIALIISAIVKKSKDTKTNFDDTVRNIYVYIILVATLIFLIVGVIATFRVGLDIILPEETTYSYKSDELTKNENIVEFFTTISLVVTVAPVFIYHNKLVRKSKTIESNKANESDN